MLGSAWFHVILLLVVWAAAPPLDPADPAPASVVVVERIDVPPRPLPAPEAPPAPEDPPRAAERAALDGAGAGTSHPGATASGAGAAAGGRHASNAARTGSGSASIADLASIPPDSPREEAVPPPRPAAAAPRDRAGAATPAQPAPIDRPAPEEQDAVAEVEPPEPPPPEQAPEEEPPPPEVKPEEQRFARAPAGEQAGDVQTDVVSSESRAATVQSRAHVTAKEPSLVSSSDEAETSADAKASRSSAGGGGHSASGKREEPRPAEHNRQTSALAGHEGRTGVTAGSTGPAGERRDRAGAASRSDLAVAVASQGSTGTAEPLPDTDDGEHVPVAAGTPAPAWWAPMATRVEIAPIPEAYTAPSRPTQGVARAAVRTPAPEVATGGTGNEADEEAPPAPGAESERVVEQPVVEATEVVRPTVEPVDELREALGWGKLDRSTLVPRLGTLGNEASTGMAAGSPQTVTKEDPLAGVVFVAVKGTPLGKYTEEVYAILEERWFALDLDAHQKALGIQGDVGVVFRISRSGKVYGVDIIRSSGNRELDRMALGAVPERLPRVPSEVEGASVVQRVTFHYRNPWLVSSAGM